eukprot:452023-Prymnesium_polylepis.1
MPGTQSAHPGLGGGWGAALGGRGGTMCPKMSNPVRLYQLLVSRPRAWTPSAETQSRIRTP